MLWSLGGGHAGFEFPPPTSALTDGRFTFRVRASLVRCCNLGSGGPFAAMLRSACDLAPRTLGSYLFVCDPYDRATLP